MLIPSKRVGIRLSPFLFDVALTTLTTAITAASLLLLTRVLTEALGPEGFGVYAVGRRLAAMLIPIANLGLALAVARYVAISKTPLEQRGYLAAACLLAGGAGALLFGLALPLAEPLSWVIYQQGQHGDAVLATALFIYGASLYSLLYAYYRGAGRIRRANLLELGIVAFGPLLLGVVYGQYGSASTLLALMGALYCLSLIPLARVLWSLWPSVRGGRALLGPVPELLHYSVPRLPGGVALGALLALAPLLAPHFAGVAEAGYLTAAQVVLQLAEAGLAAFGLVVLPKAASLFAAGHMDYLRERIGEVIAFAIHLGVFICAQLLLWSEPLVLLWLGPQYQEAVPLLRIYLLGLLPYLIYVLSRSIIDAVEPRAINAQNLYCALAVTALVAVVAGALGLGAGGLALATAVGFLTLGAVTLRYLYQAGWLRDLHLRLPAVLAANALFLAAGAVVYAQAANLAGLSVVAVVGVTEMVLVACYTLLLSHLRIRWVLEIRLGSLLPLRVDMNLRGAMMSRRNGSRGDARLTSSALPVVHLPVALMVILLVTCLAATIVLVVGQLQVDSMTMMLLNAILVVGISAVLIELTIGFDLRKPTIPLVWYLTYFPMIFIPSFFVYMREYGVAKDAYMYGVHSVLITVPLGIALISIMCRFRRSEISSYYARPIATDLRSPFMLLVCIIGLAMCWFVMGLHTREIGTPPIVNLVSGGQSYDELVLARELSMKLLNSPFVYLYSLLSSFGFPYMIMISLGYALQTRHPRWIILFVLAFVSGLTYGAYTIAKAPVVIMIGMTLLFVYIYLRGRIDVRFVAIGLVALTAFPMFIVYRLMMTSGNTTYVLIPTLLDRIFYTPAKVLFYYFELFPGEMGYLGGRAIGRLAGLLGERYFDTANYVAHHGLHLRVESASANGAFIGDLNADFGMTGVVLGGIVVGMLMQGIQIFLMRQPRTILNLAVNSYCCIAFFGLHSLPLPVTLLSNGVLLSLVLPFGMRVAAQVLARAHSGGGSRGSRVHDDEGSSGIRRPNLPQGV